MKLTWPRPCLLRPPFLRLKVCSEDEEIDIRSVTEKRHRSYDFDGSPSSEPRCYQPLRVYAEGEHDEVGNVGR